MTKDKKLLSSYNCVNSEIGLQHLQSSCNFCFSLFQILQKGSNPSLEYAHSSNADLKHEVVKSLINVMIEIFAVKNVALNVYHMK